MLCRWCDPGDDDIKCPKCGVNLFNIKGNREEVLAVNRAQTKKDTFLDPKTEKRRMWEAKVDIEKEMMAGRRETNDTINNSLRG